MRPIFSYIRLYFYELDKKIFTIVSVFTGILIYLNYYYNIDNRISQQHTFSLSLISRYIIFLVAFIIPYIVYRLIAKTGYFTDKRFVLLACISPAIFSLKAALSIPIKFSGNYNWNNYWNHIFYWPLLVIITGGILWAIWKIADSNQPFYGIKTRNMNWKPYLIMLLIMVPLIAAASTQPDFLAMYPKLKLIAGVYNEEGMRWWHKLLFELSYGSDFITIELFFRGFLILAFIKWAGKDAILPMACFYCTIHFGKPLGECISSYFGGMILGIVVYNTRSILGGLMVHLGIAWMMEIGGYIGNAKF